MPATVRDQSVLRISVRLLIFGLWTVGFGLLMLVIFVQLFGSLTASPDVGAFGEQTGIGFDRLVVDSLVLLYRGGVLTLGIGGAMTLFGTSLIVRAAR